MTPKLAILIPCFNENPETVAATLDDIGKHVGEPVTVYLIDDASRIPLSSDAWTVDAQVVLARHSINLGQGAALETARQLAVREEHDVFITMDSDGQHRAEDLHRFVTAVRGGADVVFGNRFAGDSNVPTLRKLILLGARIFERAITGLSLHDAHNGYRAFSRKGIEAIALTQNRMAHATEIKQQVAQRRDLAVAEVPVSIRYSSESLSKGQSSLGALPILRDLALRYLFD